MSTLEGPDPKAAPKPAAEAKPVAEEKPVPELPEKLRSVAIAFSGGGFRATLYHLGVLLVLLENRIVDMHSAIVGVSGGAILAAHWAQRRQLILQPASDGNGASITPILNFVKDLTKLVQSDLRGRVFRRFFIEWSLIGTVSMGVGIGVWAFVNRDFDFVLNFFRHFYFDFNVVGMNGPTFTALSFVAAVTAFVVLIIGKLTGTFAGSLTATLESQYERLFRNAQLSTLGDNVFLTGTSLTDGGLFVAGNSQTAIYDMDGTQTALNPEPRQRVAKFVCASSAFPPAFKPVKIRFPKETNRVSHFVTDGGVFDNLGIRALRKRDGNPLDPTTDFGTRYTIVSDAGRPRQDRHDVSNWRMLSRNLRASDLTMYRLANCDLPDSNTALHIPIWSTEYRQKKIDYVGHLNQSGNLKNDVALIRTDLNYFSTEEVVCLMVQGADNCATALKRDFPAIGWKRLAADRIPKLLGLRKKDVSSYLDAFEKRLVEAESDTMMSKVIRFGRFSWQRILALELISLLWLIPLVGVVGAFFYVWSLFFELRDASIKLKKGGDHATVNVMVSGLRARSTGLKLEFSDPKSGQLVDTQSTAWTQVGPDGTLRMEIPPTQLEGRSLDLLRCKMSLLVDGQAVEERVVDVPIEK